MLDGVPTAKHDIALTQLMDQLIANFLVEKLQRPRSLVDHGYMHTQGRKHRSVFNTNHAGPDHRHGARELLQCQDIVRGDDGLPIRFNALRFARTCAYREQNVIGGEETVTMHGIDSHRMWLDKGGETMHQMDVIGSKPIGDDLHFALHHASNVADQLWHSGTYTRGIYIWVSAVEVWLGVQTAYRLAKSLGGNRPGFDADAADTLLLFDYCSFFSQLRGLNRGPLSRRA